jgi:MFS transporter, DHA1 family, multidrug resistance protein
VTRIRPESVGFTLLLGALAAIPPLSIDMGLPAFPALERELGASSAGAGLTLSLFLAGFACAQLLLGPLADRFGRRPVLLAGLSLYAVAGLLCAAAPSIGALIGLRLVQGGCAASGTVMAFAIVRDVFSGPAARTRLSYVTMVLGVAPIIAPTLGSWVLWLVGWRGIYGFLGLAGAALATAVALGLSETRRPAAVHSGARAGFARMLGHRRAMAYAATNALNFGALFAFVSGSPMVLMDTLGVSAGTYGLLFALTSGGIMAGALTNGRLSARRASMRLPFRAALLVSLAAASVLAVAMGLGARSLAVLMPLLVLHMVCRGIVGPNATHGALEPMGANAGVAAAVMGCLQMATGSLCSGAVALLLPVFGPAAMAGTMAAAAAGALLASRIAESALPSAAAQMHGE